MKKLPRKDDRDSEARNALSRQLFEAVAAKDLALARTLLEAGADVDYKTTSREYLNQTSLLVAVGNEDREMMRLLFEYRADPHLHNGVAED